MAFALLAAAIGCAPRRSGSLLAAFPKADDELRLVFSESVDRSSGEDPRNYSTRSGLKVLRASVDPVDPTRVTLKTEKMPTWSDMPYQSAEAERANVKIDVVQASGVRTSAGRRLTSSVSPRFIQGIPPVSVVQRPVSETAPFLSPFIGLIATHQYNPDGGTGGHNLIDKLGFMFLHKPSSDAPFNSIKVVTKRHISGFDQAITEVREGKREGLHVVWAGGEIRDVNGETQLVDTGFMEGALAAPPLRSPAPFLIRTAEISGEGARTLRAKSLQGAVVRMNNVTVDRVSDRDSRGFRSVLFHDDSGGRASGLLLDTVSQAIKPRQRFESLRGIVHQPRANEYEVIIELDEHLVRSGGK